MSCKCGHSKVNHPNDKCDGTANGYTGRSGTKCKCTKYIEATYEDENVRRM